MEIILGKTAGFCPGIKQAIQKANEELKKIGKVECLGDLLHNDQVLSKLKNNGLSIIEKIEDAKEKTIIRAHGVQKSVYEYADKNNIELIDCTCPKVQRIHSLVEDLSKKGYYIIVIGEKKHAEVLGTFSFCERGEIIQNLDELKQRKAYLNKQEKIAVITQTTYNLKKFLEIQEYIKNYLKNENKIYNCICNATEKRQNETEKISQKVDYMIIIGGKKSSNTNKLYEIACKECKRALKIEEVKELYNENLENINKIGIMAGASTPKESIEEVIKYLKERN